MIEKQLQNRSNPEPQNIKISRPSKTRFFPLKKCLFERARPQIWTLSLFSPQKQEHQNPKPRTLEHQNTKPRTPEHQNTRTPNPEPRTPEHQNPKPRTPEPYTLNPKKIKISRPSKTRFFPLKKCLFERARRQIWILGFLGPQNLGPKHVVPP